MAKLRERYKDKATFIKVEKKFKKPIVGSRANDIRGSLTDIYVLYVKLYSRCKDIINSAKEIKQTSSLGKLLEQRLSSEDLKNNTRDNKFYSYNSRVEYAKYQKVWKVKFKDDDLKEGEDPEDNRRIFNKVEDSD